MLVAGDQLVDAALQRRPEPFEFGRELHPRAATVLEHAAIVGESIERARKSHDDFAGSIRNRQACSAIALERLLSNDPIHASVPPRTSPVRRSLGGPPQCGRMSAAIANGIGARK